MFAGNRQSMKGLGMMSCHALCSLNHEVLAGLLVDNGEETVGGISPTFKTSSDTVRKGLKMHICITQSYPSLACPQSLQVRATQETTLEQMLKAISQPKAILHKSQQIHFQWSLLRGRTLLEVRTEIDRLRIKSLHCERYLMTYVRYSRQDNFPKRSVVRRLEQLGV